MNDLPKETEQRVLQAVKQAVLLANEGMTPSAALIKVAAEEKFPMPIVQRMIEAFNISKTLSHLKRAADSEKAASFALADPEEVLGALWPEQPETAVDKAAALIHTDYLVKASEANYMAPEPPVQIERTPVDEYPRDPELAAKRAIAEHTKYAKDYEQAKSAYRTVFSKLYEHIDKLAAYWRTVGDTEPFEEVEKRAYAQYGEPAKALMDLIYKAGGLQDNRLHIKRAEHLPQHEMVFDASVEPYATVADTMFLSRQLTKLADLVENAIAPTMHLHALAHIDHLPPHIVEAGIDYFLDKIARKMPHFTDQNRPAKVKEIYRALKRDHPGMPAEEKARIAARQGKPGKQKQGPPYKAPIKSAAPLDSLLAPEA